MKIENQVSNGLVRQQIIQVLNIFIKINFQGLGKFTLAVYRPAEEQVRSTFSLTTGRVQHHYHTGTMTRRSWALDKDIRMVLLKLILKAVGFRDLVIAG